MTNRRRSTLARPLIILGVVAAGCAGDADDPATSAATTATTPAVTAPSDDFTEVSTSDEPAPSAESSVPSSDDSIDEESVPAETDTDAASTTAPTTRDSTPTETNPDGSTADTPDPTSPAGATTSTSSSTTTTTTDPATGSGDSDRDRALAAAFTAQLDADDVEELGAVFDTVCLGTEFVVAFGGAAAADAQYSLNPTTVTVDSNLFNDEPLTEATAEAVVAALGRCGDLDDLILLELAIGPDEAELGRCVVGLIPAGLLEAALVEDYQQIDGPGFEAFDRAADDAFDDCFN